MLLDLCTPRVVFSNYNMSIGVLIFAVLGMAALKNQRNTAFRPGYVNLSQEGLFVITRSRYWLTCMRVHLVSVQFSSVKVEAM